MKLTPLASISDITAGQSAPKSDEFSLVGTPFVRAGSLVSLISGIDESKLELIDEDTAKRRKLKLSPKGSILFAKSGMSATKGRIYVLKKPAYVVSHLAILRPNKSVHGEYLRLVLNYLPPSKLIKDPAYPAISLKEIASYKLPIPDDINDQKRIACLLGKVEGLIHQRKQNIQQLDDLLRSVFLDIFGFNDGTYKQTVIDKLSTHTQIVSGATKGKKYKNEQLIEMPYMRVANVQDGYFSLEEIKSILVSQKEIDRYLLKKNDILLTEGGDPDKLGRGAVWQEQVPNCIHQNHIFRVRINDLYELKPQFLSALIGSHYGKSYFLKSAKQTTGIASINSTQLKNFPTLIPAIDLQEKFVSIVEKIAIVKSQYKEGLSDLEKLYGALSQKAFSGELDLSKVPLPDESEEISDDKSYVDQNNMTENNKENSIFGFSQFDAASIKDNELRKTQLSKWFTEWLEHYQQENDLNINHFWQCIEFTTQDYVDENDEPLKIDVSDYDHIKDEVFAAIKSGAIRQTTDMIETVVDGQTQLEPGNQILLKKQH
jgi:type I restriction enzyme S subunit